MYSQEGLPPGDIGTEPSVKGRRQSRKVSEKEQFQTGDGDWGGGWEGGQQVQRPGGETELTLFTLQHQGSRCKPL